MNVIRCVATYGRVSSTNQENEGTIETQLFAVNEFAKKNGYTIVKKYADEGWTGDFLARPGLDQLRMDAKKRNWDAVLVYDPDRLARRGAWQEVVIEELKELGIEVLFVTVPPAKTDEDIIMYKMRGVFTEYERMKIKERFRLGRVRKAREGHVIATEAPFGYTFIPKKGKAGETNFQQGYYEIDERELSILRGIFEWAASGLTLSAIILKLQSLGIPPRKSKRGVWNTSTLSKLLRNKTYIGEGHFGATMATIPIKPLHINSYKKNKKSSRIIKPEDEWIKIPTPAIIDEALFNRVQQQLKINFKHSIRNTKNEYLLVGKIYCTCGTRRTGAGAPGGKHLYYRCINRAKSFPLPPTCFEKGINARIVDELVWNEIVRTISTPALLHKQYERWEKFTKNNSPVSIIDVHATEKEIKRLQEQEDRFLKAYGAEVISMEQLKANTKPIRGKITLLANQIANAQTENNSQEIMYPSFNLSELNSFALSTAEKLKDLNFNGKKGAVEKFIDKVIGNREQLVVSGYIPLEFINQNVTFHSNDMNGMDTIRQIDTTDYSKNIPFELTIKLPPPLKSGIDYGFKSN